MKTDTQTHTFNKAALETINKAIGICNQRADEYLDSWCIENLRTPYLDSLQPLIIEFYSGRISQDILTFARLKRLIIMASMCDIKLSRMSGPFKEDTYIDLTNYNGAFCTLRKEFEKPLFKKAL
jgi:hypothetical protein